ncbi:endonuclease domain-containing protein [Streptomyces panacea]
MDHCHETGRVRGVLCFNCNSAIGKLGDDPDTLRRAIAYWRETRGSQHS